MTEEIAPAPAPGTTSKPTPQPGKPPAERAVEAKAFGGVAPTVPGLIQAEEFDEGGQGVAYSDTTAGNRKGVCWDVWRGGCWRGNT